MIQGDGFFVVQNAGQALYARNGSFSFDTTGSLVTSAGGGVQGWSGNNRVVNTNSAISPIQLPMGTLLPPKATGLVPIGGNLPGDTTSPSPIVTSMPTYDAQGNQVTLSASFTKVTPTQRPLTLNNDPCSSGPRL